MKTTAVEPGRVWWLPAEGPGAGASVAGREEGGDGALPGPGPGAGDPAGGAGAQWAGGGGQSSIRVRYRERVWAGRPAPAGRGAAAGAGAGFGRTRICGTMPAARWASSPRWVGARGTGGAGRTSVDRARSSAPPQRLQAVA